MPHIIPHCSLKSANMRKIKYTNITITLAKEVVFLSAFVSSRIMRKLLGRFLQKKSGWKGDTRDTEEAIRFL